MRKFIAGIIVISLVLTGMVIAATLLREWQATRCLDFDGGLVYNVSSSIYWDSNITGEWGWMYDHCLNNRTVIEYACATKNLSKYAQEWSQDCGAFNKSCIGNNVSLGRCG